MKLILEPIFEADFQDGSFGYRPGRSAHGAVKRVAEAIVRNKTRVLDLDLKSYFDNIRHDVLLSKVAKRVSDPDVLRVLKLILKATGKRGVAQGDVLAPRSERSDNVGCGITTHFGRTVFFWAACRRPQAC